MSENPEGVYLDFVAKRIEAAVGRSKAFGRPTCQIQSQFIGVGTLEQTMRSAGRDWQQDRQLWLQIEGRLVRR